MHGLDASCMLCALAYGLYHERGMPAHVSDIITLSLAKASGDPYIVVPSSVQTAGRVSLPGVERLIGGLVQVLGANQPEITHRVAETLANLTSAWSTLDPSQLTQQIYGVGLVGVDAVRKPLLGILKDSRGKIGEQTTITILDKLCNADFRELHPGIAEGMPALRRSRASACVQEIMQTVTDLYPTRSYLINERCELMVYEQYVNRRRGAGEMMERMYGPKLRYSVPLARVLKKGVWQSNFHRFQDWYPGEEEPY